MTKTTQFRSSPQNSELGIEPHRDCDPRVEDVAGGLEADRSFCSRNTRKPDAEFPVVLANEGNLVDIFDAASTISGWLHGQRDTSSEMHLGRVKACLPKLAMSREIENYRIAAEQ